MRWGHHPDPGMSGMSGTTGFIAPAELAVCEVRDSLGRTSPRRVGRQQKGAKRVRLGVVSGVLAAGIWGGMVHPHMQQFGAAAASVDVDGSGV